MEGLSKPTSRAGQLQRACLALLNEHQRDGALPTSARFLFYELVSRGEIPKSYPGKSRTPAQDVSDALVRLREAGFVPWDYLVDETRHLDTWPYAPTVRQYVEDISLPSARVDLWAGSPPPLILCESRSLAGVLRQIAATYLCPLASTNGQAGGFLHTALGPLLQHDETPRAVLYFGDLDLSGGHIEDNARRVLSEYGVLDWRRLAITGVHVRDHALPTVDKRDNRFRPARTFPAVETEALSQREVQHILTTALDAMLPEPLREVRAREDAERARLQELLRGHPDQAE